MRKLREVLRLHFDLKLGQRQIGRSANVGQSTVHDYLTRFATAGLSWPLPAEMTEEGLQAALFPPEEKAERRDPERAFPDYAHLHEELKRHKHVTLQLLWEEYRATQPNGYRYSRFCHYYQQWKQRQDVVMRQTHRAGEKLFVDWAGSKLPLIDPKTGEVWEAPLFVAVLGASNYTYAEALPDEAMSSWLGAHVRSFQFLQGVPTLLVPDNAKTGVSKAHRYEPDLNPTYQEMASHYGVGVVPARPDKPRDKAKVEVGVQIAQRWILAALRHRQFFSLREANLAIAELLEKLNQRPFRKARGMPPESVRGSGPTGAASVAGPALRDRAMVAGHGAHRLSHSVRPQFLQRALSTGGPESGSAGHAYDAGDLSPEPARGLSSTHA